MIAVGLVGCGAVVHEMYSHALTGSSEYGVGFVHDPVEEQASPPRGFSARRRSPSRSWPSVPTRSS